MKIKFGLTQKILIGCIIFIVVPLSWMGYKFFNTGSELVQEKLVEANWNSVKSFDTYFLNKVNSDLSFFLEIWLEEPELTQIFEDETVMQSYLETWNNALLGYPEIESIYLGSEKGDMFIAPLNELPDGFDPRERPWYQDAMANKGKIVWTRPYIDVITGDYIFSLAHEVLDENGNSFGVLAIDVKLTEMVAFIKTEKISENGILILMSQYGDLIVGPDSVSFEEDFKWKDEVMNEHSGSFTDAFMGEPVVISHLTNRTTGWKLIGIIPEKDLYNQMESLAVLIIRVFIYIAIWGIIVVTALVLYSRKIIIKPIQKLMGLMSEAENGNMTVQGDNYAKRKDEIGALFKSFNHMIQGQRDMLVQVLVTATKLMGSSNQTSSVAKLSNENSTSQSEAMQELSKSISEMSISITDVTENMTKIAGKIDQFTTGMQDLGSASSDVAQSTVETAEAVSEVVQSLKQLELSTQSINKNVMDANQQGTMACEIAVEGKIVVENAMLEMDQIHSSMKALSIVIEELGNSAEQIGEILEVIEDITEQTGLLSLNASIEAARAGEHGKGFSVVANAIGRLSEKSKESTKDIERIIRNIQVTVSDAVKNAENSVIQIDKGVDLVTHTGQAFTRIDDAINATFIKIKQIAEAAEKQLDSSQSIMLATEKVNDYTMQVSASTEENVSTIEEFVIAVEAMNAITQEVSLNGKIQASNAEAITLTSQTLNDMTIDLSNMSKNVNDISSELNDQIKDLIDLVSKFKM